MDTTPAFSTLGDDPLWFSLQSLMCFIFHFSYSSLFVYCGEECILQDLDVLGNTSQSRTLPKETEIVTTTPLMDEKPLFCHVPSTDTPTSVPSVCF